MFVNKETTYLITYLLTYLPNNLETGKKQFLTINLDTGNINEN